MRRREFAATRTWALEFLSSSTVLHLASTTVEGAPVLRTVNPVVVENHIYFHGSPKGEKVSCVGRPAVLQSEHVVATIPSYFIDPDRACPATTLFQSVQVHGKLVAVQERARKAQVMSALMKQYQPQGGYQLITETAPAYSAALKGILIVGMSLEHVTGKSKLGQNRTVKDLDGVLGGLWQRGAEGDLKALELILRENPGAEVPEALQGPSGTRLVVAPDEEDAIAAAQLLRGQYWTAQASPQVLHSAHLGSAAWVVAKTAEGRVVGSARAIADTARHAHVVDVIVAPNYRSKGLGRALMKLLLDHPAVRCATQVTLNTITAMLFYERLGFSETARSSPESEQGHREKPLACSDLSKRSLGPVVTMKLER